MRQQKAFFHLVPASVAVQKFSFGEASSHYLGGLFATFGSNDASEFWCCLVQELAGSRQQERELLIHNAVRG
jgi:hypothetical protein